MRVLRLIGAGLIAAAAVAAVAITAAFVVVTGIAGFLLQLFRRPSAPDHRAHPPRRPGAGRRDDVIDVVATRVPDDPAGN